MSTWVPIAERQRAASQRSIEMSRRSRPLLVVVLGGVLSVAALAAWDTCDCGKLPLVTQLAHVTAGLSFLLAGALALTQPPRARVGGLMAAVGAAWFIDDVGWIYHPLPYTFSRLASSLFQPLLAHLALSFPSGRLANWTDRALVGFLYAAWAVESLASLVFWDPADAGCPGCPRNLLLLDRDPGLQNLVEHFTSASTLVLTALVIGRVVQRWSTSTPLSRRALAPVVWAATPIALAEAAYSIVGRSFVPPLAPLAMATLPAAFLVGLVRMHLTRADVGRLVVALGDAPPRGQLRVALARTLHDPSLEVVYWLAERQTFVDVAGKPTALPGPASGRAATVLERDGEPIAALLHDPLVGEDPTLIGAAAAAARLAIDNERLQAEIRAQLDEVRASRARIVQAADAERRRIERNLHDGSQQRLVAVSMALAVARSRAAHRADADVAEVLREASDELTCALAELRELARGIHPATLAESGLGPALRSLAQRSAVPVTLAAVPEGRLPPAVEVAAYYVVAEAITNAVKHAHATSVSLLATLGNNGSLRVEVADDGVGGAVASDGSGLQGLADRVGALDGRLSVDSPVGRGTRIVAVIPCAS